MAIDPSSRPPPFLLLLLPFFSTKNNKRSLANHSICVILKKKENRKVSLASQPSNLAGIKWAKLHIFLTHFKSGFFFGILI
jgi:hypothetical protein